MKALYFALFILLTGVTFCASAQADSASAARPVPHRRYGFRDSVYAARLNHSGNLMIAAGVGLAAAGSFLIYEGVEVYNTPAAPASTNPSGDVMRNHSQGTVYLAAGAIGYVGAAVLIALGARNKIEFKHRLKMMALQAGLLDSGNLGAALTF